MNIIKTSALMALVLFLTSCVTNKNSESYRFGRIQLLNQNLSKLDNQSHFATTFEVEIKGNINKNIVFETTVDFSNDYNSAFPVGLHGTTAFFEKDMLCQIVIKYDYSSEKEIELYYIIILQQHQKKQSKNVFKSEEFDIKEFLNINALHEKKFVFKLE